MVLPIALYASFVYAVLCSVDGLSVRLNIYCYEISWVDFVFYSESYWSGSSISACGMPCGSLSDLNWSHVAFPAIALFLYSVNSKRFLLGLSVWL